MLNEINRGYLAQKGTNGIWGGVRSQEGGFHFSGFRQEGDLAAIWGVFCLTGGGAARDD